MFLPANGRNPQLFHINTSVCLSYIYLQLWLLVCLYQHWQTLSIRGQIVNTSGFEAQTVSITTLQLCHHSAKAAIDQKNETNKQKSPKESWLCSNKTLFVDTEVGTSYNVSHIRKHYSAFCSPQPFKHIKVMLVWWARFGP